MDKDRIIAALYASNNVSCDSAHPLRGGAGFYQPIYLDHRNLLSFPQERETVLRALATLLPDRAAFDVIAGNETAGIALAALLAERLGVPMAYIRKKPKAGGAGKQIEGLLNPGARVVVVDDMIVTGGNISRAVDAVRRVGGTVVTTVVISTVRNEVPNQLAEDGVTVTWLATFREIVDWGVTHRRFTPDQITAIEEYLADPSGWGARHGWQSLT